MGVASRYSAGASRAGINTADSVYFYLRNTGTADRIYVVKFAIGIAIGPTSAPLFYLSRGTNQGSIAASTTLAGLKFDENDVTAGGTWDSAWTTSPTITTSNKIDAGGLAVTPGGWFLWTFYDQPLIIKAAAGEGIAIVNAIASGATAGQFVATAVWDE